MLTKKVMSRQERKQQFMRRVAFLKAYKPADYCYYFQELCDQDSWTEDLNEVYDFEYKRDKTGFSILIFCAEKERYINNLYIVNSAHYDTCNCQTRMSRTYARMARRARIEAGKIEKAMDGFVECKSGLIHIQKRL